MTMNESQTETFTTEQATDEAVLLLIRKLRRLHPAVFTDLMNRIPQGAVEALQRSEMRADSNRDAGISTTTREWPTDLLDEDEDAE